MPSVFENLSEKFYTFFLDPNPDSRRVAIERWVKDATPIVQAAVEGEVRTLAEMVLNNGREEPNWKHMAEKFSRYADIGKVLTLEFKIGTRERSSIIAEKLSPEVRAKTIELARKAFPDSLIVPASKSMTVPSDGATGDDCDDCDGDDRSDSMNPNNDAYHAAMDNHANQMNPNNDAYWSSRGR